jgi:hypothetical protein
MTNWNNGSKSSASWSTISQNVASWANMAKATVNEFLLLENGGYLLLETGDRIILEQSIPGAYRGQQ